jgi:hypothetical protein
VSPQCARFKRQIDGWLQLRPDLSSPPHLDPGKIPKPIDVGERHFSFSELRNASDFVKFHPPSCSYRTGTPATVNCEKEQP